MSILYYKLRYKMFIQYIGLILNTYVINSTQSTFLSGADLSR